MRHIARDVASIAPSFACAPVRALADSHGLSACRRRARECSAGSGSHNSIRSHAAVAATVASKAPGARSGTWGGCSVSCPSKVRDRRYKTHAALGGREKGDFVRDSTAHRMTESRGRQFRERRPQNARSKVANGLNHSPLTKFLGQEKLPRSDSVQQPVSTDVT